MAEPGGRERAALERAVVFGATSAIAQEVVRILARRGAALALVARDEQKLAAVAADARVRGARAVAVMSADLNDAHRHEEILARAESALGSVDLVLVAQGMLGDTARCEASRDEAEVVLRTNFVAPALLLSAAGERLARRGGGTLVAISSVAGDRGRQSNYFYGAAKGGLSTFLQGLRNRLSRRGVHVLTVKPGPVDTPMTADMRKNALFAPPDAVARSIVTAVERRREVVYVPWFWRAIMFLVRLVPERVFKRLSM